MSVLREMILRTRLRDLLRQHHVGRLLERQWSTPGNRRKEFVTRYTDGNVPAGRQLLRRYKNAEKEVNRWVKRHDGAWRHFAAVYREPNKRQGGYLEVVYMSSDVQDDQMEEF